MLGRRKARTPSGSESRSESSSQAPALGSGTETGDTMVPRGPGAVVVSILLIALLSLFAVASPPVRAQEKVYHLASSAVTLDLDTNGSIRIAEPRAFRFDLGTFVLP